jgi:hypothetical protein
VCDAAVGTWAAYWMLPIDMRYGVWASSGEIDIYEMKNEFIKNNMALHYGGPWPKYSERFNAYENRPGGGSFSDDFTVVTMDWSPTKIQSTALDCVYMFNSCLYAFLISIICLFLQCPWMASWHLVWKVAV